MLSHGQACAQSGAVWCQVPPTPPFFSLGHIKFAETTVKTQLFPPTVSSPLFSALLPSTLCKLGQMAALGQCVHACECVFMHAHVCGGVLCLIVLCMINCCDSRNVCVTRAWWSESISCLFWVSLAGYHSKTCANTLTHTHTLQSKKHDSLLTHLLLVP